MPVVSVIVPAHNAERTLPRTLAALESQDLDTPYEVIVVDDGSSDRTADVAELAGGRVRVVRLSRSAGASAARNRGASEAEGSVFAFTDADCYPTPAWLSRGLRCLEEAGLVVGAVRPEWGVPMMPFDRSLVVERETGLYESANVLVRRELFERVGGFEPWIHDRGRPLSEDVWLGWRVRRAGASTAFCPAALVEHAVLSRAARGYVEERLRARYFPAMVARIPELREQFLYARWFLTSRTAAFDAAIVALVTARVLRSPLPLAAATPYARHVLRRALPFRKRAPLVAATDVIADSVGLAALLCGSAGQRTIVL